jgi:two-component system, chemotaxis family, sensor kinase CheA
MRKLDKKANKRTLKRRILKMLSLINFNSLLIMLISLMLLFGATVSVFGEIVSRSVSKQMSEDLELIWGWAVKERLIINDSDMLTPHQMSIFKIIGEDYELFNKEVKPLDSIEEANMSILIDDQNRLENVRVESIRLVEYEILRGGKVIFSSMENSFAESLKSSRIMNLMSREVETPFIIEGEETNGIIRVRFSPVLILTGYITIIFIGIIIFFITHFIAKLLARTFSGMVVKPLNDLEFRLNQLAEGNVEAAISTEIVLKQPIKEVESLANSTNKIISKMSEYVSLMESHKSELEAQNVALEENSSTLTSMNAALANQHSKLKNILNHVEQGFLTFSRDLYIDDEYSLECERIFGKAISNNKLSDLLYPDDDNMQRFINDLIIKIFYSSESQRKLYLTLLPEEVVIRGKNINITYKVVTNENNEEILMLILNDITEKRKLEKRMDEEKNILKMVVKAIINRNEFLQLVNEYKNFAEEDFCHIEEDEFEDVLRNIHNFKGNFSQFDMINIVKKLDELENKLYESNSNFSTVSLDGNEMLSWLNEDIEIIETYSGREFLREEEIFYIRKSKLLDIEERVRRILSSQECRIILPMIKSLAYKSVKDLLRNYPSYVDKLSERLNKPINQMEIAGDDVFVDTNHYKNLSKVLVHIFRNCVDHGIENEDERLEKGKDQSGNIKCNIESKAENFSIIISDDGRGIDVEALEKKSVELGLYTTEQILEMTQQQRLDLIFEQGISTKEIATTISGRGVGMSSVKKCIEDMGGYIEVESKKDMYTRFIITVPKIEDKAENILTASKFMEGMINTTKDIILDQAGINMSSGEIKEKNIIELNKVTSLINLKGSLDSIVMISANDEMADKLVEGFIFEKLSEEEKDEYAEDVLGEVCNTILGNTFGLFDGNYNIFHMGIPAMISNNGAYVKYTDSAILTASLEYGNCKLNISMLVLENESQEAVKEELTWQEY